LRELHIADYQDVGISIALSKGTDKRVQKGKCGEQISGAKFQMFVLEIRAEFPVLQDFRI
jgi:hypothetical protein